MNPQKIIIDTDIGTNVDDAVAISLAVRSPEIKICGITTVFSDTLVRAKTACHLLSLLGREDIPVYLGIEAPLLKKRPSSIPGRPVFTAWQKDDAFIQRGHAVSFLIDTVMSHPREITLVTIAPLTNIAVALIMEPHLAQNVKEIVMMGGVTRLGSSAKTLPAIEHNVCSDPEAADMVFSSGIPITMFGLDSTYQVPLKKHHFSRLRASQDGANIMLADMAEEWMRLKNREESFICDPLPIMHLLDTSLFQYEMMDIKVSYNSEIPSGQTLGIPSPRGNVRVCLEAHPGKTINFLMNRLCPST